MNINRQVWVTRHDPVLTMPSPKEPLTVGNGSIAFNMDVTGLQTLYEDYTAETPLCTMANWGWHITPADNARGFYTPADVVMNRYDFCGREVRYAKTKFPGNEHVYDWIRQNPHKFSMARIGLRLNGEEIHSGQLSDIHHQLHLYEGWAESSYLLEGEKCHVITACHDETDTLVFRIESPLLAKGLSVDIDLPYPAPDITGADWNAADRHQTVLEGDVIRCQADAFHYELKLCAENACFAQVGQHRVRVSAQGDALLLTVSFAKEAPAVVQGEAALASAANHWRTFWERGGAIDLSKATDERAMELERRIVLSLYLMAINSSGIVPPAETGLTCNSWFGKAHLEMHYWHMAWAPLWGHEELLLPSLGWYHEHLEQARENASRNGYRGVRWQKMVGEDGVDSPSGIAPLLVWQQPHIITMLEMIRRAITDKDEVRARALMQEHWILVKETAEFMADYVVPDEQGVYHIMPPVIPVQERHAPEETYDPAFEVSYWRFGMDLAIRWAEMLGEPVPARWMDVRRNMATPPVHEGLYMAHAQCPNTFVDKAIDHPSMLQCLGMLPGEDVDPAIMEATLNKVMACWDYVTLWGWDFAVIAMTATRLGLPKTALDQLLCVTHKNTYVVSGNNRQISRRDLPLYLPGNGGLLLTTAMMAAGYEGSGDAPGFAAEGWHVEYEGLKKYF